MTQKELFESIQQEINYSETTILPTNPPLTSSGGSMTELGRLRLIDLYMLSQYRDSNTDQFGNQMVFYNISSLPVEVASKMLDFDTKDIMLIAEDGRYWETWLMQKELGFWMKDKFFGRQLNEYAFNLPRDGHIILKKVDDDIQLVPLKNLRMRPDALNLESTPIIEKFEYQPDEFIDEAKKRGWENWRKVELNPDKVESGYFDKSGSKVVVYGAWYPEGFLDMDSNYFLVSYDGHVLADMKRELFYKGLPWEKLDGRLLGRGTVEKLFNEQIYLNRIANYKADGLNWASKKLFQTRDIAFDTNLLGDADNGEVFVTNDSIDPVLMEERNLSFYSQEEARWETQAMRRVFSTEPATGGRAPSGTPLGSTILQAQMTAGFYDQKKENLAMFVKEIIWDWIMPEFKKESRPEHKLMMRNLLSSEGGAEKMFQLRLNEKVNKAKMFSKYLPPEMWEIRKALMAEQVKEEELKVPKGMYDNLKMKMEIVITGESIDTASKLTTLQTLFQIIGSNPAVLQNKVTKNILFKMLNLAGFNPRDFEGEDTPDIQQISQEAQAQRGGSIAAPSIPQIPQQVQTEVAV